MITVNDRIRHRSKKTITRCAFSLLLMPLLLIAGPARTDAQTPGQDCGIVDAITLPIDGINERGNDFGIYRARFGGLHTAIDVAFYRYGDPVHAIARGRVTYADPEGWDTEKGVVIVEHTFPDGEIFYSVYGHMEPIGDYFFPAVGQCVTPETIVGAVGNPALSAPHLHFEIRSFGPDDGGPGYWDTNPLEAGWRQPLDFIRLWQIRLMGSDGSAPAPYISHVTALRPPGVPPLITSDGGLIVAEGAILDGVSPAGRLIWRMELSSTISGMIALPDDRILTHTADNSILMLRGGRYETIWTPDRALTGAPMWLGDVVAFFTGDNALAAYTPEGALRWVTLPLGDRVGNVVTDGSRIAVGTRPRSRDIPPAWHVIGANGQMLYQVAPANPPLAAAGPQGDFYLLDGDMLYHISADYIPTPLVRLPYTAGRSTALLADTAGSVYVFMALDESLLYAYDSGGQLRWQNTLPGIHRQPLLLASGEGCLLYALAADGTLYAIRAADGAILGQAQLYAGGVKGSPAARLLEVLPGERVRFGAGYLTVVTLDGYALAGIENGACPADPA